MKRFYLFAIVIIVALMISAPVWATPQINDNDASFYASNPVACNVCHFASSTDPPDFAAALLKDLNEQNGLAINNTADDGIPAFAMAPGHDPPNLETGLTLYSYGGFLNSESGLRAYNEYAIGGGYPGSVPEH